MGTTPAWRRVDQHALTAMTNNLTGLPLTDSQSGYLVLAHRRQPTSLHQQGPSVENETHFLSGPAYLRVTNVPTTPLPGRQQAQRLLARSRGHRRHGQPSGATAATAVLLAAPRAAGDGGDGGRPPGHPDDEPQGPADPQHGAHPATAARVPTHGRQWRHPAQHGAPCRAAARRDARGDRAGEWRSRQVDPRLVGPAMLLELGR
jgi:hypothetical protein